MTEKMEIDDEYNSPTPSPKQDIFSKCNLIRSGHQTRIILNQTETPKEDCIKTHKQSKSKAPVIIGITIVIALIVIPVYDRFSYNRKIDVDSLMLDLRMNVINQDFAVEMLMESVKRLNSKSEPQLLAFVGKTGVGKTHITNYLKQYFKPKQIFESFPIGADIFYRNIPYLVLKDDFSLENDLSSLTEFYKESLPQNRKVLVILLINTHGTYDGWRFTTNEYLSGNLINKLPPICKVIEFNPIHRELVKNIYFRADKSNPDINYSSVIDLINEHDFDSNGFKGFFSKLKLLNNPNLLFIV